jgi:hypothetical protein
MFLLHKVLLVAMRQPMRIRKRRKKKRENARKQLKKLKTAEKRSTERWRKNAKRCVRKSETK